MIDIAKPKVIEILIREDGTSVWINGEDGCLFRACRIGKLIVKDDRKKEVREKIELQASTIKTLAEDIAEDLAEDIKKELEKRVRA